MYTLKWCSVKWIFSIVSPKAKSLLFCPILFHRIKIMKQFQMENTYRCHAMNYPRGEIKFTHNLNLMRQKNWNFRHPEYLFYKNLLYSLHPISMDGISRCWLLFSNKLPQNINHRSIWLKTIWLTKSDLTICLKIVLIKNPLIGPTCMVQGS